VQKLAGHADTATRVKYYTGVVPDALRSAQAKRPFHEVIRGACDVSNTYRDEKGREKKKAERIISLDRTAS